MSAFGGKADVIHHGSEGPLIAISGLSAHKDILERKAVNGLFPELATSDQAEK